jgi:monooxygenase
MDEYWDMQQIDTLIIGAGISGLGLAVHLKRNNPNQNFLIVEARHAIGGTWDLFKYPGIRSDSDMATFGFAFKPWSKDSLLADAASIKGYLAEVVAEYDLQSHIVFNTRVMSANYDSDKKCWCLSLQDEAGQISECWARFVVGCTGYYDYQQPYQPQFNGQQNFQGQLIHPQHWPQDLDYQNKKIVVIGSGATAVTLLPALVKGGAAHVTMLQRSPSYVATVAAEDGLYKKLKAKLPEQLAYKIVRGRNIATQRAVYFLAQKQPKLLKSLLIKQVDKQLKAHQDLAHFQPNYMPWQQRLCAVPDGDLFQAINSQQASIMTDEIAEITTHGMILKSGQHVAADIIVTATGLNLQILGGLTLSIDGQAIDPAQHMLYQSTLPNDVPNFALMIGYINASWTLKVDLVADYLCRLWQFMQQHDYQEVVAQATHHQISEDTVMGGLNSGYIQRAQHLLPKQGQAAPWLTEHNYFADRRRFKRAKFNDGILLFKH